MTVINPFYNPGKCIGDAFEIAFEILFICQVFFLCLGGKAESEY